MQMNAWRLDLHPARLDPLQHSQHFPMQPGRVDRLAYRQISRQLAQPLPKLPDRARRVVALGVIQSNRKVNQRLQKQPPRPAQGSPFLFEHLVTLKKFPRIKKSNSLLQQQAPLLFKTQNEYFSESCITRPPLVL